jgi:hypothetical protein
VSFDFNFVSFSLYFMQILLFSWVSKRYEKYEFVLSQHFALIFKFIEAIFVNFGINFVSFVLNFVSFPLYFMQILTFSWVLKRYEKYEFVLSQHFSLIFRFYWLFFWVFVLHFVSFVHNFAIFPLFSSEFYYFHEF